jgi:hypothetical protein
MDKPALKRLVLVIILFGLLLPAGITAAKSLPLPSIPKAGLSIEARIAYQQAVERIYFYHSEPHRISAVARPMNLTK